MDKRASSKIEAHMHRLLWLCISVGVAELSYILLGTFLFSRVLSGVVLVVCISMIIINPIWIVNDVEVRFAEWGGTLSLRYKDRDVYTDLNHLSGGYKHNHRSRSGVDMGRDIFHKCIGYTDKTPMPYITRVRLNCYAESACVSAGEWFRG